MLPGRPILTVMPSAAVDCTAPSAVAGAVTILDPRSLVETDCVVPSARAALGAMSAMPVTLSTTAAASAACVGEIRSASLAETLYRYFAVDLDKSQRAKFNRRWDGIWTDELVDYALSDVIHLPRLMQEQMAWMERLGMLAEFEQQMARVVVASPI